MIFFTGLSTRSPASSSAKSALIIHSGLTTDFTNIPASFGGEHGAPAHLPRRVGGECVCHSYFCSTSSRNEDGTTKPFYSKAVAVIKHHQFSIDLQHRGLTLHLAVP